jgi:hypothetical protein
LLWFNLGVLVFSTLALFAILHILLNYQMRNRLA